MMLRMNESGKVLPSPDASVGHLVAASNESQLDFVFGWAGSNVWLPCGRFFPADSDGRSAVGHETQKQMS